MGDVPHKNKVHNELPRRRNEKFVIEVCRRVRDHSVRRKCKIRQKLLVRFNSFVSLTNF